MRGTDITSLRIRLGTPPRHWHRIKDACRFFADPAAVACLRARYRVGNRLAEAGGSSNHAHVLDPMQLSDLFNNGAIAIQNSAGGQVPVAMVAYEANNTIFAEWPFAACGGTLGVRRRFRLAAIRHASSLTTRE